MAKSPSLQLDLARRIAIIKDVKPSGTSGGAGLTGSYQTRTLNTLEDPNGIVTSLASNQFTLPAGTYLIEASAPAFRANSFKVRIYNITDSANAFTPSSHVADNNSPGSQSRAELIGIINITSSKTFELQQRDSINSGANCRGVPSTLDVDEIYSLIKITKLD